MNIPKKFEHFFKFLIEVVGEKEFESEDIEKKYFLLYEKYSANLISESNSITQKHITSFSYSSLLPLKITITLYHLAYIF